MIPKITFGIIVLNGEPFTRYNLRAIYPFAHQIIVVEGAGPHAVHASSANGHSVDGTLDILHRFTAEEDPEHKIVLVTAEDEGHPNGFWPGEKDEQSRAYARRATGDWLWQIDIDEFYQPADIQRVVSYLQEHPSITCLTFQAYHFWGGFDYNLSGGLFMSYKFQGEPWGAYRRLFKWSPGSTYTTHRPPTVHDATGRDMTRVRKRNASRIPGLAPVVMYHYTNVFPHQVLPKGAYYANLGQPNQRTNFESFQARLDTRRAVRIYDHYGTYNWLERFTGTHPPSIQHLIQDIQRDILHVEMRHTDDIESVLRSPRYRLTTALLGAFEYARTLHQLSILLIRDSAAYLLSRWMPTTLLPLLPRTWQTRVVRLRERALRVGKLS